MIKVLVLEKTIEKFEKLLDLNKIQILNKKRSYKNKIYDISCDEKTVKKLILENDLDIGTKIL